MFRSITYLAQTLSTECLDDPETISAHFLRNNLQTSSAGLCVGNGGVEAYIHGLKGIIQVDDDNAFNRINRKVFLHNINYVCPEIVTFTMNCYATPARLFVMGGVEIKSCEGTTQGDPTDMPIYAICILPLLSAIVEQQSNEHAIERVKHVASIDDLTGGGSLIPFRKWWVSIIEYGPSIGYDAKASKSWLIVKEQRTIL